MHQLTKTYRARFHIHSGYVLSSLEDGSLSDGECVQSMKCEIYPGFGESAVYLDPSHGSMLWRRAREVVSVCANTLRMLSSQGLCLRTLGVRRYVS